MTAGAPCAYVLGDGTTHYYCGLTANHPQHSFWSWSFSHFYEPPQKPTEATCPLGAESDSADVVPHAPSQSWAVWSLDKHHALLADKDAQIEELRSALESLIGDAAVCHDYGPVELYELEDAALRARRVLGKAP